MSEFTILTANTTYCTNQEGVMVAPSALPHVKRWLAENGYIHVSEAHTARVHELLATSAPCAVPDTGDEE